MDIHRLDIKDKSGKNGTQAPFSRINEFEQLVKTGKVIKFPRAFNNETSNTPVIKRSDKEKHD